MTDTILEVKNLVKHFRQRKRLLAPRADTEIIPAVDDISFYLRAGETLGLVGESGCGKTTAGKTILKLLPATAGQILFNGEDITHLERRQFRPYRRHMQMIFQDLDAALNPKMRIRDVLQEAVKVHSPQLSSAAVKVRVGELLDLVNLKQNKLVQFPAELSGGEKRRVGIARTLAVEPKLIIADEPTSALDVSIQAQVINLMRALQNRLGLSYLFISHDLQLVELISHKVAVMYLGQIVEMGVTQQIARAPRHPYTRILWSSLVNKRTLETTAPVVAGNWGVYDFERPAAGCRFASRCPIFVAKGKPSACTDPATAPQLKGVAEGHQVRCHFPLKA